MSGTRLFLGGLSTDLSKEELSQKLSNFAPVVNLDVREKKCDISGEIVKKFAFATLDASGHTISQCIQSLDGSNIKGSAITVQIAQESFIEKLKREREEKSRVTSSEPTTPAVFTGTFRPTNPDEKRFNRDRNVNTVPVKREFRQWNDGPNIKDEEEEQGENSLSSYQQYVKEALKNQQQNADEEMVTEDTTEGVLHSAAEEKSSFGRSLIKDGELPRRYKPSKSKSKTEGEATEAKIKKKQIAEVKPSEVAISSSLAFTGASSGFSLLNMFGNTERVTEEAPADATDEGIVMDTQDTEEPKDTRPVYTKSFFFPSQEEIEDNLNWAYQSITPEGEEKFRKDRLVALEFSKSRERRMKVVKKKQAETFSKKRFSSFEQRNNAKLISDEIIAGKLICNVELSRYNNYAKIMERDSRKAVQKDNGLD